MTSTWGAKGLEKKPDQNPVSGPDLVVLAQDCKKSSGPVIRHSSLSGQCTKKKNIWHKPKRPYVQAHTTLNRCSQNLNATSIVIISIFF
jgi:hypothetical protein